MAGAGMRAKPDEAATSGSEAVADDGRPAAGGAARAAGVTRAPGATRRALGLTLRVDLGSEGALGPGKVRLLELIEATGSITAAGREMGMSYRRAWLLVDTLNRTFGAPVVATRHGGKAGGGAGLTPLGHEIARRYRAIEAASHAAAAAELGALARLLGAVLGA